MITMEIDKTRMKDKFSLLDCNAFFLALEAHGAPWYDEQLTGQASNLAWLYFNRSRQKLITSMVKESNSAMSAYAEIILQLYGDKWSHIWDLYQLDYNPIENYNMIESGSDVNTKTGSLDRSGAMTRTGSLDRSGAMTRTGSLDRSGAVTRTGNEVVNDDLSYSGKEANTRTGNIEDTGAKADNQADRDSKIYGYNSSTGVNSESDTQQSSHKNTQTFNNVKDERSFTDRQDNRDVTTTYNSVADTDSRKETYNNIADTDTRKETYNNIADTDTRKETYNNIKDTGSHSLTRSGNIGTTTTQMMAESEIEYRKHLFFEMVFSDIDHILTLPVY